MKRFLLAAFLAAFSFPAMAQVIVQPITPAHRLPYAGTSVRITSSFTANTEFASFTCTTACFIQLAISGRTPVAVSTGVTSSIYLPADTPTFLRVPPNGKVAAIQLSSAGVLIVQEMSR
jgi:hypothetical protein